MGLLSCFRGADDEDDTGVRYNPNNPFRSRNRNADGSSKLENRKEKDAEKSQTDNNLEMSQVNDDDDNVSVAAPPVPQVPLVKKKPPKNPPWKVKKIKIYDGLVPVGSVKVLAFKKKKCANLLALLSSITRDPKFYEEDPEVKVPMLLNFLDQFKAQMAYQKDLEPLVDFLEWEYEEEVKILDAMIANGEITFDGLWYLFKVDSRFITKEYDEPVGALVQTRYYEYSTFGSVFKITGNHITTNGRTLSYVGGVYPIFQFSGLRDISSLRVRPMTDDEHQYLHSRGLIFREIAAGSHYKQYTGNMFFSNTWSTEKFKATGRVMIDPVNFSRFNPDYKGQFFVHATAMNPNEYQFQEENNTNSNALKNIPDKTVFTCVPTIAGFSLTVKRWGQLHVKDIGNIKFDSNAYDILVMDPQRKQLVRSLVENSTQSFTDVIAGKGGGVCFLLHGSPGTGKTLTAEAIADLLERPLYSVTVGELGVTAKDLEGKLRQILELAWEWDAVLLIDEADIFLERRSHNDIKRNAMVGIFLRLLEYHQGVLFLTSNRVKSFDPAFHSRISVALHYEALDQKSRKQVFVNLMQAAKINSLTAAELNKLSEYELNGRQIKSTIRLAQSLAFTEGVPVRLDHMEKTVNIARQFQEDLLSDEVANEACNFQADPVKSFA